MIKQFEDKQPQLGHNVYVSENAMVIGEVTLGDKVNIWLNFIKNFQFLLQASFLF